MVWGGGGEIGIIIRGKIVSFFFTIEIIVYLFIDSLRGSMIQDVHINIFSGILDDVLEDSSPGKISYTY